MTTQQISLIDEECRNLNDVMRYPNTIEKNIYLAYIRKENVLNKLDQKLDSVNLNWDLNYPESLVELCIKTIAEKWNCKFTELNFFDL